MSNMHARSSELWQSRMLVVSNLGTRQSCESLPVHNVVICVWQRGCKAAVIALRNYVQHRQFTAACLSRCHCCAPLLVRTRRHTAASSQGSVTCCSTQGTEVLNSRLPEAALRVSAHLLHACCVRRARVTHTTHRDVAKHSATAGEKGNTISPYPR